MSAVMRATTAAPSLAVATRRNAPLPVPTTRVNRRMTIVAMAERKVRPGEKGAPLPPPTARDFLNSGEGPRNFWDSMTFAGPAPEVINGRLAMLGFTAAMAAELATGRGVVQQFWQAPIPILLTFGVFVAASLVPILRGANLQPKYGFWRPNAEIINGRAAMVGLVALLITEWYRGSALWGV